MINAIIFDFDSTLVDYHFSDSQAIDRVISLLPGKVNRDDFLEHSGEIIRQFYCIGEHLGSGIHEARLRKTVADFGFAWQKIYLAEYLAIYLGEVKVYDGVFDLLDKLKDRVKIGLLTNSTDAREQRIRIEKSALSHYFDRIDIAAETGLFKPYAAAFESMVNNLKSCKEQALYIGDSEEFDILGANNAGLKTVKKVISMNHLTVADDKFTDYLQLAEILKQKYDVF